MSCDEDPGVVTTSEHRGCAAAAVTAGGDDAAVAAGDDAAVAAGGDDDAGDDDAAEADYDDNKYLIVFLFMHKYRIILPKYLGQPFFHRRGSGDVILLKLS